MSARLKSWGLSHSLLAAAFLVAVGVPLVFWLGGVYSGTQVWPGLVGNFTASFFAFVIALTWDRRRAEAERQLRIAERRGELEDQAREEYERRASEARRRFSAVLAELKENKDSVDAAATLLPINELVLPQLLRGSWAANAQPLSVLIADSALIGDLSTFYGRVEELQWRLRYRAETLNTVRVLAITGMTLPLAVEMQAEVDELITRVTAEIDEPSLRTVSRFVVDTAAAVDDAVVTLKLTPSGSG